MYKFAVIDSNNTVENIVLWDESSTWAPPQGRRLVKVEDMFCSIGWKYENDCFVDPSSAITE